MNLKDHPIPDGTTSYCSGRFSMNKGFGKKPKQNGCFKKLKKKSAKLSKKIKKLSKKLEKINKLINKKFSKKRGFGSLGLPDGVRGASNIYQTFPDIYHQGPALPQPYGPVDNLRMQSRMNINGFGTTPGTPEWLSQKNTPGGDGINLYDPLITGQQPNVIGQPNFPAQFSNNQLNGRSFGPNNVGYEPPIPIYHGGANTIDFQTNKMFNVDMVGELQAVQPTTNTPTAWLANHGKKGFGSKMVYTPSGPTSGRNVIMQPAPSTVEGLGSKSFGETTLVLHSDGSVQMS